MVESSEKLPVRKEDQSASSQRDWPFFSNLWREMDNLFENFGRGWFRSASRPGVFDVGSPARSLSRLDLLPAVDIVESDMDYRIMAELPGLTQDDVDISLSGDVLTLRGEKAKTREEADRGTHISECQYGAFSRSFTLPPTVDREKIDAKLNNGILTVVLPKSAQARVEEKKIKIKAS